MKNSKIFSSTKGEIDWVKIKSDLAFIKSFQNYCNSEGWRLVVYGGYGLDILLGQITRTHNDLDVVIYGQGSREDIRPKITTFLTNLIPNATFKISDNDFMAEVDLKSPGLGANIYFVQVSDDPHQNLNRVVKRSGEVIVNSEKNFPPPVKGTLQELQVEVQNPASHLADILHKRDKLPHRPSHDQDIRNLRQITDPSRVNEILSLS